MDRKFSKNSEIERLIQISHSARCCLENEAVSLKQRLDFPARIRGSLKQHPTGWFLGLLTSGLAAGLMFRRKPAVAEKKRRSIPFALLGLTLTAVRPFAKVWLTDQVKNYLTGQLSPSASRNAYPSRTDSPTHP
jgi:hypothetical protein